MRVALVLPLLLLAGCLEDEPVPAPPAEPEAACEARGIFPESCSAFCAQHAEVCGTLAPLPDPYPETLPPPPVPPSMPAWNGTSPVVPELCAQLPEGCPEL